MKWPLPIPVHVRPEMNRNRFGEKRSAFNWFPAGVYISEWAMENQPWIIEQEKYEYALQGWSWLLAGMILAATWMLPLHAAAYLLALIPPFLYPGAYAIPYPGSVHVRRAVETRSRAAEGIAMASAMEAGPDAIQMNMWAWAKHEARGMATHKAYNLKLEPFDIAHRVFLHMLVRGLRYRSFERFQHIEEMTGYRLEKIKQSAEA